MELQINDLVSSIKKDGIEAAKRDADEIIAKAKADAAEIIENAKREAKKIKENADSEAASLKESVRLFADHAKRDAELSFKESVKAEFEKLLRADTKKVLNGKALAELIKAALSGENPADYEAQVAEVTEELKSELAALIKDGLEIRPSKSVRVGFRLSAKDSSGYFDCSDEEISQMLAPFFPELNI